MIVYQQSREAETLARKLSEAISALREPGLSAVQRILLHASCAAYRHALQQARAPGDIDDDIEVLAISRRVSPTIALMATGLCAFLDRPDLADRTLSLSMHQFSGGAMPPRIFRSWRALYVAAAHARKDAWRESNDAMRDIEEHLARRISTDVYFQIRTLANILENARSANLTGALYKRNMHLLKQCKSADDLYHPAGLLDLHSLATLYACHRTDVGGYPAIPTLVDK